MKRIIHIAQILSPVVLVGLFITTSPAGQSVVVLAIAYVCIFLSLTGLFTLVGYLTPKRLSTSRVLIYSLTATALLALNSIERLSAAEIVLVAVLFTLVGLAYSKRYVEIS